MKRLCLVCDRWPTNETALDYEWIICSKECQIKWGEIAKKHQKQHKCCDGSSD